MKMWKTGAIFYQNVEIGQKIVGNPELTPYIIVKSMSNICIISTFEVYECTMCNVHVVLTLV